MKKRGKLNLLIWCAAKDGEPSVLPHRRAQDKITMHLRMAVAPTCNTNKGMSWSITRGREGGRWAVKYKKNYSILTKESISFQQCDMHTTFNQCVCCGEPRKAAANDNSRWHGCLR